ncbi:hypothetical protein LTR37_004461 [Vermiconidia calcicola]|uniref:Uncharacterized protein n=1 Tax=Vermiconidia calcicola TaxID=1690605 RepID=A0ACC3NLQ8_9PEZI|nr:hypothetical protein LTR37_004461 [Vermiconidia calcicola]
MMDQYWKLINIDKRCSLLNNHGVKLVTILSSGEPEQLIKLLSIPSRPAPRLSEAAFAAAKTRSSRSRLIALPQELIIIIVSYLINTTPAEDTLCLALSCAYFFRLLAPSMRSALATDTAPWAGDRLVLVGDYAEDVPSRIHPDEVEGWRRELEAECTMADHDSEEQFGRQSPLYNLDWRGIVSDEDAGIEEEGSPDPRLPFKGLWNRKPSGQDMFGLRRGALARNVRKRMWATSSSAQNEDAVTDDNLLDRVLELLKPAGTPRPATDRVLRNLTTRQYVRESELAAEGFENCLGEVICVLAQWAPYSSGTDKAAWAACRFDITSLDDLRKNGGEWEDTSEKAVDLLQEGTEGRRKEVRVSD